MKTFFIDNYGCAKNQVDAEEMATRLSAAGWSRVSSPEAAGLYIVNTCGFIEDAKKESIGAVVAARAAYPHAKVLVAGCLSQRYAAELAGDLVEADGVFGNADLSRVTEVAEATLRGDRTTLVPQRVPYRPVTREVLTGFPGHAYLKIAEGCSNRCSFCAIPLIRGDTSSRPPEDVAAEFGTLVGRGIREVSIIGQDLGSYGLDLAGRQMMPELLKAISSVSGDWRVRLLYIHPDRFPYGILEACSADSRIAPYFDLPFQHASRPVLRAMNRSGDADRYLALLADIRSAVPTAVIRSTFLVGFPGETDDDVAELLRFQDRARMDWLGTFAYSREEDTPAWSMKNRVPKKTATARKAAVEQAQRPITEAALSRFVGTTQKVLVEELIEGEDLAIARGYMNAPEVDGAVVVVGENLVPGTFAEVVVSAVRGVDLEAVPRGR